jgi:hypothetical protein
VYWYYFLQTYRKYPPTFLQFAQHNPASVRLNRVHRLAVGKASAILSATALRGMYPIYPLRKIYHALREPNLSQLLILLTSHRISTGSVIARALLGSYTRFIRDARVIEH